MVELIYRLFLDGKTPTGICKELEERGIPTPGGGQKWTKTTIDSILTNEKYKGDALLQKTFTTDFLEKTKKKNEGEVPQYYVEESHEAIIDPDIWAQVQTELARRKALGRAYSGKSTLSAKLVCEDCGNFYGRKIWHSTDAYRKEIWQCNRKFKGKNCDTPIVSTEEVRQKFIRAYNQQMADLPRIIADCELMRKALTDFEKLDAVIEQKDQERELIAGMVRELVKENASTVMEQEAYRQKYESLNQHYKTVVEELNRLMEERTLREHKDKAMGVYIRTLRKSPLILTEWNDTLWTVLVEKAIIHRDKSITFIFYNGSEITVGV